MAPLRTQLMAKKAYDWERLQVGLDNVAIELGQRDRALLRYIEIKNQQLFQLDIQHDIAHQCARKSPVTAPCVVLDASLEVTLETLLTTTELKAKSQWILNTELARRKIKNIDKRFELVRNAILPVTRRRCQFCHKSVGLRIHSQRLISRLLGDQKRLMKTSVAFEKIGSSWNYALRD